ncbi:MAG: hypothetical protein RL497_1924 [Pseudomonadota bacterium]|jgi:DNA-binding response OmpR family regulator
MNKAIINKTILVADDDERIVDLICRYLELENFNYHKAYSGTEAMVLFEQYHPDLVVLDIMLPKLNGTTVCEKIRALSATPIIMVTACGADEERLHGFAKGADDYLCKPFNPRELMARIKAILRRANSAAAQIHCIMRGVICLNLDERIVTVDSEVVELTAIEFNLLSLFMSYPSKVFSREELLDGSHAEYTESYSRSVDFHIKNLRRKINLTNDSKYIKAVYGVGYKLN